MESELAGAALKERAGKAARTAGNHDIAVEHYRRAAAAYRRQERFRDGARADTGAGRSLGSLGHHDEARALLRDALSVLDVAPDNDTVEALDRLAVLESASGDPAEGDRLSTLAASHAQALDLPDTTLALVLGTRGFVHKQAGRAVQAAAYQREALRRAEAANDSWAAGNALINLADLLLTSNPSEAAAAARAAGAHNRRIGEIEGLGFAQGNLLQALLLTGDWDEAEQVYQTGVSEGLSDDPMLAFGAVLLRAFRGDDSGARAPLPLFDRWAGTQDPQELATAATASAAAAAAEGNAAAAHARGNTSLSHAAELGLAAEMIRWAWAIAADAALALGDRFEVVRLLDWLGQHTSGHIPGVLRAERLRIQARLLAVQGNPAAAEAFQAALKAFRELGSPYHLAVALLDQADYLASAGGEQGASQLAAEANAIAERLGAKPLLERASRLAPQISVPDHVLSTI